MTVSSLLLFAIFAIGTSDAIFKYTLRNEKVCDSRGRKQTLKLAEKADSALRVTDGSLFDTSDEDDLSDLSCTFEVVPRYRDNVSVVIQNLSLRRHENGACIDYVKFTNLRSMQVTRSPKLCGDISAQFEGPNPYLSFKGKVLVEIFVSGSAPKPEKKMKLDLVFTASKECSQRRDATSRCEGTNTCIWSGFFADGVVNCPFEGCLDEKGCSKREKAEKTDAVPESSLKGKLARNVILYGVILFLLFAIGATIGCSIRDASRRRRQGPATAPPFEPATFSSEDGPPPYESLFPQVFEPPPCRPEAAPLCPSRNVP